MARPHILVKLRAAGVIGPERRPGCKPLRWKGELLEACKAMYEGDYTVSDVARHFKAGRKTVRALAQKYGWKRTHDGRVLNMQRLNARPERADWDAKRVAGAKAYWEKNGLPQHLRHRPWKYREMLSILGREETLKALA